MRVMALAILVGVAVTGSAQDLKVVKVNASSLNVRSGPSTGYSIIGQAGSGQLYVSVATSGGWHKIRYNENVGWVSGSYVSVTSGTILIVTAASLNVRTGPGTGYSVVGSAPKDSGWVQVGTSGSWKNIFFGGASRWISGTYTSVYGGGGSTSGGGGTTTTDLPTSSVGYKQLPASGTGFYCYSVSDRRWGTPTMVYGLISIGQSWAPTGNPRMGVGDISLKNGGPISGHASHQVGKDVDIRPVRNDGVEGATSVGYGSYSKTKTEQILLLFKSKLPVKIVFFNDSSIYNKYSWVQYWDNHYNHFHCRIY